MLVSPPKTEPMRMCAACRTRCPVAGLLRFVRRDGVVVPDVAGRLEGRGLSLGPALRCVERAAARQVFARGLKAGLPAGGLEELRQQVVAQAQAWLWANLNTALQRGGAEAVATPAEVFPVALRSFLAPDGADPGMSPGPLGGLGPVRVTSPHLAERVAAVAAILREFTFAMAGDSTRRPRSDKTCDVLESTPGAGNTRQRSVHGRRRSGSMPASSKRIGGGAG